MTEIAQRLLLTRQNREALPTYATEAAEIYTNELRRLANMILTGDWW